MSLLSYFETICHKEIATTLSLTKKKCYMCFEEKPLTEFPRHKKYKDGYDSRCRLCKNRTEKHVYKLKKTAPEKPAVCECCGVVPDIWVLDHDHKTGAFRGWLCSACNLNLGRFGDSIQGLERAINYLKRTTNGGPV